MIGKTIIGGCVAAASLALCSSALASDVGRSHTVSGFDSSERAQVTLLGTRNAGRGMFGEAGKTRFTILLRVRNVGRKVLDDCGDNDATLIGRSGVQFETSFDSVDPNLGCFKVRPGGVRLGWVTFAVPRGWSPRGAHVQFTLDAGFADDIASWRLG